MDCKAACMVHCNKISELLNQKQTNKLLHKARDTVTLFEKERVQFSFMRNSRRSKNVVALPNLRGTFPIYDCIMHPKFEKHHLQLIKTLFYTRGFGVQLLYV